MLGVPPDEDALPLHVAELDLDLAKTTAHNQLGLAVGELCLMRHLDGSWRDGEALPAVTVELFGGRTMSFLPYWHYAAVSRTVANMRPRRSGMLNYDQPLRPLSPARNCGDQCDFSEPARAKRVVSSPAEKQFAARQ